MDRSSSCEAAVSFQLESSVEESDDVESFQGDLITGWTLSGWTISTPGKDDGRSLYSSGDHAYALSQKEFGQPGSISFYVKNGSGNVKFLVDGEGNTRAIVQDCDQKQIAARYCLDLITFDDDSIQDDWYLPALRELQHPYLILWMEVIMEHTGTSPMFPDLWQREFMSGL